MSGIPGAAVRGAWIVPALARGILNAAGRRFDARERIGEISPRHDREITAKRPNGKGLHLQAVNNCRLGGCCAVGIKLQGHGLTQVGHFAREAASSDSTFPSRAGAVPQ